MIKIRKHYDLIKTLTWISQVVQLLSFFLIQDSMQDHFAFSRHEPLLLLSHFSRVRLCATPWTAAHQAPQSLGFSKQEYWSGVPFPSPMHESEKWKWSRSVVSDPQRPHGTSPKSPWIRNSFSSLSFMTLTCLNSTGCLFSRMPLYWHFLMLLHH